MPTKYVKERYRDREWRLVLGDRLHPLTQKDADERLRRARLMQVFMILGIVLLVSVAAPVLVKSDFSGMRIYHGTARVLVMDEIRHNGQPTQYILGIELVTPSDSTVPIAAETSEGIWNNVKIGSNVSITYRSDPAHSDIEILELAPAESQPVTPAFITDN